VGSVFGIVRDLPPDSSSGGLLCFGQVKPLNKLAEVKKESQVGLDAE